MTEQIDIDRINRLLARFEQRLGAAHARNILLEDEIEHLNKTIASLQEQNSQPSSLVEEIAEEVKVRRADESD